MANTTLVFAALLILLGAGGYAGTGMQSPTALIPAAFGLLLAVFGFIARKERLRKHAMHGAVLVGLLGFLGSASAFAQLPALLSGGDVARPAAVAARAAMAVLTLVFVALCIRSFIAARRARSA